MSNKPEVLLVAPYPRFTLEPLEAAFTVHRHDIATDKAALVAEVGPRVRAIATNGHVGCSAELMDACPNLKIIGCNGVGYDAIDIVAAKARGITVTNTPDVLTDDVADTAILLLLASMRDAINADHYVRSGQWPSGPLKLATAVRGKHMGILGLGRIGHAIADRATAFGMTVSWTGPRPKPDAKYPYVPSLVDLAAESDVLVAACPGGAATYRLVTAEVLAALGPTGTLVNIARGSVVDEPALIEALRTGKLGFAALDVFEREPHVPQALIEMKNVVLFPHIASATIETRTAMGQLVIDNLLAFFDGKPVLTRVV